MAQPTVIVRCPHCGAGNRVSEARLAGGAAAVCGRCKTPLPVADPDASAVAGGVTVVTDATFDALVARSPVPVLLDLWAPWCGPCRMLAPVLDGLARQWGGRVRVAKLNVDENPTTAGRFRVGGIPLLIVLQGGREVDRLVGVQPGPVIRERVERAAGF